MKTRAQLLGFGLVLAAGLGCYNPDIKNGGLLCNGDPSKGPACPDGYSCSAGHCVKNGTDAGIAGSGGVGGAGGAAGASGTGGSLLCTNYKAPTSCAATSGLTCDPYCQSGCGTAGGAACNKCNLKWSGTAWSEGCTVGGNAKEGDTCTRDSANNDSCMPGLSCLPGADNTCLRCGKVCRTDADCPGSTCYWTYTSGTKTCDFAPTTCNPVLVTGCSGSLKCYWVDGTAKTVCDCPGLTAAGSACEISRDCVAGHACVAKVCRRLCSPAAPAATCGTGSCVAITGLPAVGYCQ